MWFHSGELEKSIANGVNPNKIVFLSVGKTSYEIELAIKKKIKQINVESVELDRIRLCCKKRRQKIKICLRVNPISMPKLMKKFQQVDQKT